MVTFCIILSAVIIALLIALWWVYYIVFYSPDKRRQSTVDTPEGIIHKDDGEDTVRRITALYTRPHERVTIRSYDGRTLSARVYEGQPGKPVSICCHGYRGTAIRDMSGGATVLLDQGHTVILIDERAHMSSSGHTITYGIRERYDVRSWVDYAISRCGSDIRINLVGISMGAATVLMACSLPLPDNVKAVSADCPYNDVKDIICYVAGRMKLPAKLLYPLIYLSALLFGHFRPNAMTAAEAVRRSRIPAIIIHGEADTFVPAAMSRQIYDANPEVVERYTFPGAEHGLSFVVDEERYTRIFLDFLHRHDAL